MATVKERLSSLRTATQKSNANFSVQNQFARSNALDLLYKNFPYTDVKSEEEDLRSSSVDPDKLVPRLVYGEVFLQHQIANRGLSSSSIDGHTVDDFLLYTAEGNNVGVPGTSNFELLNNIYINGLPVYSLYNQKANFKDVLFAENQPGSNVTDWGSASKQAYIGGSDPITGEDIDETTPSDPLVTADISQATPGDVLTFANGKWRPGKIIGMAVGDSNDLWANTRGLQFIGADITQNPIDPRVLSVNVTNSFSGLEIISDASARTYPGDGTISTFNGIKSIDFIGAIAVSAQGSLNVNLTSVLDGIEVVAGTGISVVKSNVGGRIRYTINRV